MILSRWIDRFLNLSPLMVTVLISAILHLLVIVSIKFEISPPKFFKDVMPPLDVVLVNAKTKSKPRKADALAQANLNRGGNTDANRQMKTALPAPNRKSRELQMNPASGMEAMKHEAEQTSQNAQQEQKRQAELEKQAQELMTRLNAVKKVDSQPSQTEQSNPKQADQPNVSKKLNLDNAVSAALEIERREAQIAKQFDEYQKRPKTTFIGARTQEYRFATYVEAWRQKIEKIGTLNFPEEAKTQKIYGQLRMTVSLRADGSIVSIEINQSSGHRVLDDAAVRIVRLAAPFPAFPEDIRKDTDILGITRTWTFTKEDSLATQ